MCFHFYADDTQIYLSFKSTSETYKEWSVASIEACVRDINEWMLCNKLKLNNDKTEVLVIGAHHRPRPQLDVLSVGDECIKPSAFTRNLGIVFDNSLTLERQVITICKASFFSHQKHSKNQKIPIRG